MIVSLLVSQISLINFVMAEETTGEQLTEKQAEESNSEVVETESKVEGTTVEETTTEISTTEEIASETKQEESSAINNEVENFVVVSDNLPDYVEISVEEQEIEPFQTALDKYYVEQESLREDNLDDGEIYNEDDEEIDNDEDEDDSEDEIGEENDDNDDEYIDGGNLEDEFYSDMVIAAYKITFININDGTEYKLPEGESVKIKVNNKAYDKAYAGGVMNLKEDNSIEMIEYQRISEDEEESTYEEDENVNDDEEKEDIEEENGEEEDSDIEDYEYNEEIEFEVVGGERYAILSGILTSKSSDDIIKESANEKKAMVSPKTGIDNRWYTAGMLSIIFLSVSAYNYKKKKFAKVHKTN